MRRTDLRLRPPRILVSAHISASTDVAAPLDKNLPDVATALNSAFGDLPHDEFDSERQH